MSDGVIILLRSLAVWAVMMLAETFNGALRTIFLIPALGGQLAGRISFLAGSVIILAISVLFIKWIAAKSHAALFMIGGLWAFLTMAFEVVIGKLAFGYSWERVFSEFNPGTGSLMLFGLILLLFVPLIASYLRGTGQ